MSSTRSVISPGIFADAASTTIPPTPVAGVSYRDPVAGPLSVPDGWPYAERVNSAEFNQLMYQYSSLLSIIDKQGILGWTDLVDYTVPAIVFGSDGVIYTALQASGPSTTARDPISSPLYWKEFGASASSDSVQGTVKNLKGSATGTNANASYTADQIIVEDSSGVSARLSAVSVSPSLSASGANGLDTGTSAASTWYSVWVIYNPATTTTAGLFSLSSTAPTMPSGYTMKARVGWVRSDATGNKYPLKFFQYGNRSQWSVASGSNLTSRRQMATGVAGNISTPTWVAVAVGLFVPPTASSIDVSMNSGAAVGIQGIVAENNQYGAFSSNTNPPRMRTFGTTSEVSIGVNSSIVLESTNIYWASSGAMNLYCDGWSDNL